MVHTHETYDPVHHNDTQTNRNTDVAIFGYDLCPLLNSERLPPPRTMIPDIATTISIITARGVERGR